MHDGHQTRRKSKTVGPAGLLPVDIAYTMCAHPHCCQVWKSGEEASMSATSGRHPLCMAVAPSRK